MESSFYSSLFSFFLLHWPQLLDLTVSHAAVWWINTRGSNPSFSVGNWTLIPYAWEQLWQLRKQAEARSSHVQRHHFDIASQQTLLRFQMFSSWCKADLTGETQGSIIDLNFYKGKWLSTSESGSIQISLKIMVWMHELALYSVRHWHLSWIWSGFQKGLNTFLTQKLPLNANYQGLVTEELCGFNALWKHPRFIQLQWIWIDLCSIIAEKQGCSFSSPISCQLSLPAKGNTEPKGIHSSHSFVFLQPWIGSLKKMISLNCYQWYRSSQAQINGRVSLL